MSVTPSQFDLASKMLDATAVRHRVIGQNIANVNTPGYERREVSFEPQLDAMLSSHRGDLDDVQPEIVLTEGLPARADGNNVDIDTEMGQLTKNSLLFETYSQILATQLGMIRSAISGRP